ncbi:MAG: hydrogenase iron-sulfur subunit [Chloroflexi bacterium]|nr:hydrogenase iron-sulfur subunit [Chloroflexota bacterium]
MNNTSFQPKIVAFVCNWGAYSGAEAAGLARESYPAGITLFRLPCLGGLRVATILDAFALGTDGVILLSCAPASCHFDVGNRRSEATFAQAGRLLRLVGVDDTRLRQVPIRLGDGKNFADELRRFVEDIRGLGPSQVKHESYRPSHQTI